MEVSGIFKMKDGQNGKTYYDILVSDDGLKVLQPPKERPADGNPKEPWEQ